ncbi:RNA polymerase sigma-70 factor [Herbiconiux sp. VKM Ac-1786]|uniref:RNA polymerase sigma-70 factor n=1 Tax=Herbiconiux sp. VKM Ac-1786 TaxID=2783824 RepID=UPI00188C8098|nr:RNA polymerase sigma-70 factor [Herbiconiux sp. VKM Ac-1786]MBF4572973.1 RNA polymerase sigma-70 factor [Herbiconiux sp. VKM Ac-1786]
MPETTSDDAWGPALEVFGATRGRLFGIAYRMLGSASEAEDIVQETWLRWQATDRDSVLNPAAFLATTTTRLAITAATSARARHESYVGPWLPEPVDTSDDPTLGAERAEALSFAVLLLLEKLTPTERAAYVLREAFDYSYGQIAEVVQLSEPACRQLVSRAKKHLQAASARAVSGREQERLLSAFVSAAQRGDLEALERVLAADVVSYSDGGGAVRASRIPVLGRLRVAKFVRAFHERFWQGVSVSTRQMNGQATVVLRQGGAEHPFALVTVVASTEGIEQVLWMMNPAKLAAAVPGDR